ncbi:MAG: efflux RND transporter permease subunit [Rubripirellula sp.]|nr:efflux RND transporter permease subunit [Rubripirellula sp.]
MSSLFFRNPRLLVLTIALILVSGLSSYYVLPRMEDPLLTERVALATTLFPGADAERVESLVTEKLEEELREIEEIKELRSLSRSGVSTLIIELRDDVYEVETVWSWVRDKLADADLPSDALPLRFEQMDMKAYAMIVALLADDQVVDGAGAGLEQAHYAIIKRLAKQLEDRLSMLPGTEMVDRYGVPEEEILVEVDQAKLIPLGLTVADVSRAVGASDSKISAGQLRSEEDLFIEVAGEFDSLQRVRQVPIQANPESGFVRVADLASVTKGIRLPPSTMTLIEGKPAISLGILIRPNERIDHWTAAAEQTLDDFAQQLPRGIELRTVFKQNDYVGDRLAILLRNLCLGGIAVALVVFLLMGYRSALIVGVTLPLAAFMVMTGMRLLDVPIHQMSVTGLIIALGLLIDNAIVMVDEVNHRLRAGDAPVDAVAKSVRYLAFPLFGSTITTALAFAPIALMPGPAGEFVDSIAVSVILAIFSSLFLALTVIPTLAGLSRRVNFRTENSRINQRWWRTGWNSLWLADWYRRTLHQIFKRPWIGVILGLTLPLLGFLQIWKLDEQFFPPSDRDQFYIELELSPTASIQQTLATAAEMRRQILQQQEVEEVTWFLGESAPMFYYNVVPRRRNTPNYAQALVQLDSGCKPNSVIHALQENLDSAFPDARVLVRQLEQGPPFDAPVEIRIYGPDLNVLRRLGDQVRLEMSQLPDVVHTRSDLGDTIPKIRFNLDEEEIRLAGLSRVEIANQLSSTLEGAVAGSILEATEELPVRVRVDDQNRSQVESIASMDLLPTAGSRFGSSESSARSRRGGVPISALASIDVIPLGGTVTRFNHRRMNEVQAYTKAGVLPDPVLEDLKLRLKEGAFQPPPGYSIEFGGESAKRNEAIGNLLVNVFTLSIIVIATLVLSFGSFRIAAIILCVAALSIGLGIGALSLFGYPVGFMAIIGIMGLAGVAINDTIVVLVAVRGNELAARGDAREVREVVTRSTRHVVATSLTTMAGFIPLFLGGGGFWPPLAIAIAGGVGGATILALYFAPSVYLLTMVRSDALREAE